MKIIGLTGGIACGKSEVASALATLGAVVLDADQAAHEVINLPAVQQLLIERWGKGVICSDNQTDRASVARLVFAEGASGSAELEFLEQTLHPRIRERFEARLAELAGQGVEIAVIDAPLLLEAGWENLCDDLVYVDSPREVRLERAKLRNWTEVDFAKREARQMPIAEKRERSTHVLANSGTLESLRDQVNSLWPLLKGS